MKEKVKPSDLRIGNWYMSVKFNKPVQCDLSDLFDLCAHADGAIDDPPIERMFSPIPLSPEWLQRAGFVDESTVNIWMDKIVHPNFPFVLVQSIYKTFRLSPDNFKAPPLTLAWTITNELKFVHQLQNLFFCLCGKELEFTPQTTK